MPERLGVVIVRMDPPEAFGGGFVSWGLGGHDSGIVRDELVS